MIGFILRYGLISGPVLMAAGVLMWRRAGRAQRQLKASK